MGKQGGRIVGGALADLRSAIADHYGALAEIREGLPVAIPDKPDALVFYEMTIDMGIPLVNGGLRDQPHIWMMEYKICKNEVTIWEAVKNQKK